LPKQRIAYLGPDGSFTSIALRAYLSASDVDATPQSFSSIVELFDALNGHEVDQVIVPIENSLGGEVYATLDGLMQLSDQFCIQNELYLPVEQSLLASTKLDPTEIQRIYTHPQSYSQCAAFIKAQCQQASFIACSSNAEAAIKVSQSEPGEKAAVIAHKSVADLYKLSLIQEAINDNTDNTTRFVVISKHRPKPSGQDKSSFIFSTHKDKPGSLCELLLELSNRHINMTRITSRPSKGALGDYVFFIDCVGHAEQELKDCLAVIKEKSAYFRFLGSYPQGALC